MDSIGKERLLRYLNGESDVTEREAIENWLSTSEENRQQLEELSKFVNRIDRYLKQNTFNSLEGWEKVKSRIEVRNQNMSMIYSKFSRIAAVLVLALIFGGLIYQFGFNQSASTNKEIVANAQVLDEFILPDGSVVAINRGSKLIYPEIFSGDTREVTIIGEAFFDVVHDPNRPFIIHAGSSQVRVLGTSFNVLAYPGSNKVEVTVESGSVQVSDEVSDMNQIILKPGEKGTYIPASGQLTKSVNTNPNYIAWKTNILVFDDAPLNEVVKTLEKLYSVDIKLRSTELYQRELDATFDQKSINFILNVLELTFDLELNMENGTYVLQSRNVEQVKP